MKFLLFLICIVFVSAKVFAAPGDAYAIGTASGSYDMASAESEPKAKPAADGYENDILSNNPEASSPSVPLSPEARKLQEESLEAQEKAARAKEAARLAEEADEEKAKAAALEKSAKAKEERAEAAAAAAQGEQPPPLPPRRASGEDQPPPRPPKPGSGDQPPPRPPKPGEKPPATKPADGGYAEIGEDGSLQTSEADRQKDLEKKIAESETIGCERESTHSDPICTQDNGRRYNQRTKEEVSPATRRTPKFKPRDTKRCYDQRSIGSLGRKRKVCERFDGSTYDQKTGKSLSAATRTKEEARQHALDHEDAQEQYKKSKYGTRDDKRCYMKGVPGFRKEVCERFDGSVYNKQTGEEISGPTRTAEEAQQHAYEHEMKEEKEKKDPTIHCARKSTLSLDKVCTRESGEEYDPKTGKVIKPAPGAEQEEDADSEEGDENKKALVPSEESKDQSAGGTVENRSEDDECEYPNPESRSMVCTTADGTKYDKESGQIVDGDDADDFADGDGYDVVDGDGIDTDDDAEVEEDDQFDGGEGDDEDDDGDAPDDDGLRPRNLGDGDFDDGEMPEGDGAMPRNLGGGDFDDGEGDNGGFSGSDSEGFGDGSGSGDGDDLYNEGDNTGEGEGSDVEDTEPFQEDPDDFTQEINANETLNDIYSNPKRLKWSRDQTTRDNRDKFLDDNNLSSQVSSGSFGKNTMQNVNPITSLPDGFVQQSRVRTGVNPFGNNSRFMKLNAMSRYDP
ncbi:MAG: hypothetical protein CMM87_00130 [Rickettsiales bacterium]|nr:hypothetical protein [Rickettsiales bacterium]